MLKILTKWLQLLQLEPILLEGFTNKHELHVMKYDESMEHGRFCKYEVFKPVKIEDASEG